MTTTDVADVRAQLARVMADLPALTYFGLGASPESVCNTDTTAAEERERLAGSAHEVAAVVDWLRENVTPTRTINPKHSSYGLKHLAQHDLGYVSNGVFIAAAVIAGYRWERLTGTPNAQFGMGKKSLERVVARHREP